MSGPQEEQQTCTGLARAASEVLRKTDKDVFGPDVWQPGQIKPVQEMPLQRWHRR